MSRVGFEIMIPASKRAKTVHALDHSATVTAKLKLSVCLIKHYAMKTYGGVKITFLAFLTSALHRGEW
jgi:hypothetical protein